MFSIKTIARKGLWTLEEVKYSGQDVAHDRMSQSDQDLQNDYTLTFSDPELPGVYTALRHKHRGVVMVDAPWEYQTQLGIVQMMKGRVLIGGLGVGQIIDMIVENENVYQNISEIVVLESEQDVIDLVAKKYKSVAKLKIILDDAKTCDPKKYGFFDVAWFDIWDTNECTTIFSRIEVLTRWSPYCELIDAWEQQNCLDTALSLGLITMED